MEDGTTKNNCNIVHSTIDITGKNILIIGKPASGKTWLAAKLYMDNPGHKIIHTDDFIKYGYLQALYMLLEDLAKIKTPTIIEGVLGYRLLRKGVERNCYYPDIVVELEISDTLMYNTYARERKDRDVTALKGFNKAHDKILNDYKVMPNVHPPQWIKLNNQY